MGEPRFLTWILISLLVNPFGTATAQEPEDRIEHLIKAAVHLEQAGYGQMAEDVRQLAGEHDQLLKLRLLESKRAQLAALQAEIEQLQLALKPLESGPRVTLRLKVLELSMGKLRDFGLGMVSIHQLLDADSPPSLLPDGSAPLQLLETFQLQGFAEVVAEPTATTTSGRPISFQLGGAKATASAAHSAAGARIARRLECTPTITPGGTIRLKAAFLGAAASKQPEARGSEDHGTEDGNALENSVDNAGEKHAGSPAEAAGSTIDMTPDKTLILAVKGQSDGAEPAIATLILVKAKVNEP